MSLVVPTIMAETTEQLQEATARLQPFARRVHFDISDGEFAPTFLLNEAQLAWPQGWEVDIHAMVKRPSEHLARLIQLKPSLVILHAEADEDVVPQLELLRQSGIKAGVGILKTTVPSTVEAAIKASDHVMIFSGDLGKFGGTASLMQLEKVRMLRRIKPNLEIGWDGGVNAENAYTLTQGGIDVLNVGGAIAKAENPAEEYNKIVSETNKHGVL